LNTITMNEADDALLALEPQVRAWMLRLRSGQATPEDAEAFRRWCAERPEHAAAVEMMGFTWSALDQAAVNIAAEEARTGRRWSGPQPARTGRRAFIGFAVAAGASWLVVRPPLQLWPALGDLAADYRTGTGEQRRIVLSERVVIEMNTQTRIDLLPAQAGQLAQRGIDVLAGEAEIVAGAPVAGQAGAIREVAVVAGRGRMQAWVARFNVRRTGAQVCVTCEAGAVTLEHPQQRLTLLAGQQVVYDDRTVQPVASADPAAATAWRRGLLIFDGVPLAQVIDEINRYRPGKLILRNAELGTREVSAKLSIDKLDSAIGMIRRIYGAHVTELPGNIVLLS
jgi:transmembrane sensor